MAPPASAVRGSIESGVADSSTDSRASRRPSSRDCHGRWLVKRTSYVGRAFTCCIWGADLPVRTLKAGCRAATAWPGERAEWGRKWGRGLSALFTNGCRRSLLCRCSDGGEGGLERFRRSSVALRRITGERPLGLREMTQEAPPPGEAVGSLASMNPDGFCLRHVGQQVGPGRMHQEPPGRDIADVAFAASRTSKCGPSRRCNG